MRCQRVQSSVITFERLIDLVRYSNVLTLNSHAKFKCTVPFGTQLDTLLYAIVLSSALHASLLKTHCLRRSSLSDCCYSPFSTLATQSPCAVRSLSSLAPARSTWCVVESLCFLVISPLGTDVILIAAAAAASARPFDNRPQKPSARRAGKCFMLAASLWNGWMVAATAANPITAAIDGPGRDCGRAGGAKEKQCVFRGASRRHKPTPVVGGPTTAPRFPA